VTNEPTEDVQRPFIVCPSCGRLTPGNVVQCVECGEPIAALVAAVAERRSEMRFAETVFSRMAPATWAIIAANVLVFILMVVAARTIEPGTFNYTFTLINFGAKQSSEIDAGEYWRLVTPMFLHIGLLHLFVNMYSLYVIGPQVERLYGTSRYLVLYVLSGIGGVLGSYLVDKVIVGGDVASAGASGALFGLLGVLIVFGWRHRNELPGVYRQAFSPRVFMPVLILNLVITFAVEFIDKGAHIGGLAAGGLLALVIPFARPGERSAGYAWWIAAALAVAAVGVSFSYAYRNADPLPDIDRFIAVYNASDKPLGIAGEAVEVAAAKSAVSIDTVEAISEAALAIDASAGLDDRSRELLSERKLLLERAASLLGADRSELNAETASALVADIERHRLAWDTWLEKSGSQFGLAKETKDTNSPGGNDGDQEGGSAGLWPDGLRDRTGCGDGWLHGRRQGSLAGAAGSWFQGHRQVARQVRREGEDGGRRERRDHGSAERDDDGRATCRL